MPENTELETLIAVPEPLVIAGQTVNIKQLLIDQLPAARKLTLTLFNDPAVKLGNQDFIIDLEGPHIDTMKALIDLMIDESIADLTLSIADFMKLFSKVMEKNDDFFLLIMTKVLKTQLGPLSSSDSSATDTPTPKN